MQFNAWYWQSSVSWLVSHHIALYCMVDTRCYTYLFLPHEIINDRIIYRQRGNHKISFDMEITHATFPRMKFCITHLDQRGTVNTVTTSTEHNAIYIYSSEWFGSLKSTCVATDCAFLHHCGRTENGVFIYEIRWMTAAYQNKRV